MTSEDDLTLLKQLYQRGEISDEQYDLLRRHVLWGTPLPQPADEPTPLPAPPPPPVRTLYRSGYPTAPPGRSAPADPGHRGVGRVPAVSGSGGRADELERPRRASTRREPAPDRPAVPAFPLAPDAAPGRSAVPAFPLAPDAAPGRSAVPAFPLAPDAAPSPPVERRPSMSVADLPEGATGRRAGRRSATEDLDGRPPRRGRRPTADAPRTGPAPTLPEAPQRRRTRNRRGPRLLAGLTSLALALTLVAAGVWWLALREIGVDAPVYARSVCSSVRDWQQAVDSGSSALVRSVAQQDDRRAVRKAAATYYTDLAGRTDALRAAVVAARVVDVPGGQAYADSLAAAVGDQSAALRDLATRAGRLDVGSEALFQVSLQSLLTGAETAVSDVTAALARPGSGTPAELRLALSDEPACAPYVG